jgi:hypothetical protein
MKRAKRAGSKDNNPKIYPLLRLKGRKFFPFLSFISKGKMKSINDMFRSGIFMK